MHRAAAVAAPIIAELQDRIRSARDIGKRQEPVTKENLTERNRTERGADPEKAEIIKVRDIIPFVLEDAWSHRL